MGRTEGLLEITNLYVQRNPCCTQYLVETDSNESNRLPLISPLGVIWQF
jgi:hypothetical protein